MRKMSWVLSDLLQRLAPYAPRPPLLAPRPTPSAPCSPLRVLLVSLISLLLSSCAPLPGTFHMPGDAAPVVKIGLIAPFEGLGRPLGYAVLPAVKIALAEANAGGELGRYRVALVALNDDLDPRSAAGQAKVLAQDPDVLAALGPWSAETAAAAAPLLSQAGIPALVPAGLEDPPVGVFPLCPTTGEPEGNRLVANRFLVGPAAEGTRALLCVPAAEPPADFVAAYQARTGSEPGPEALLAYAAARAIVRGLAQDVAATGRPTRAGVVAALAGHPVETVAVWYRAEKGRWVR